MSQRVKKSNKKIKKASALVVGVALATPISTVLGAGVVGAQAPVRQRTGSSSWTPHYYQAKVTHDTVINPRFHWAVQWNSDQSMRQLKGTSRGLELKARLTPRSPSLSTIPVSYTSTFPTAANAYLDTQFSDPPGEYTFGIGVSEATFLSKNTLYQASVLTQRNPPAGSLYEDYPVRWSAMATTRKTSIPCLPTPATCMFNDYTNTVIREQEFIVYHLVNKTSTKYNNTLQDASFDFVNIEANWKFSADTSFQQICQNNFDGNCKVQFKSTSGISQIMQIRPVPVTKGSHYTAEIAVRCPVAQNDLPCGITVETGGYNSSTNTFEERWASGIIPNNKSWYICRVDFDRGFGHLAMNNNSDHTFFTVRGTHNSVIEADMASHRGYFNNVDATAGDSNPPGPGLGCENAVIYNG